MYGSNSFNWLKINKWINQLNIFIIIIYLFVYLCLKIKINKKLSLSWGHSTYCLLYFHSRSLNVGDECMCTYVSCNEICSSPSQPKYEKVDHVGKTLHIRSLSNYSSSADSDLKTWHHQLFLSTVSCCIIFKECYVSQSFFSSLCSSF